LHPRAEQGDHLAEKPETIVRMSEGSEGCTRANTSVQSDELREWLTILRGADFRKYADAHSRAAVRPRPFSFVAMTVYRTLFHLSP
jgi:hypothetical protein